MRKTNGSQMFTVKTPHTYWFNSGTSQNSDVRESQSVDRRCGARSQRPVSLGRETSRNVTSILGREAGRWEPELPLAALAAWAAVSVVTTAYDVTLTHQVLNGDVMDCWKCPSERPLACSDIASG